MKNKFLSKYFIIIFLVLVCLSMILLAEPAKDKWMQTTGLSYTKGKDKITILLDAGHGGFDPGKVGVNGAKEKDINLSIAMKLKELLIQNDINVVMTREEDKGLYSEGDSNKKRTDMSKRVALINNSGALIAISIHQNSFTQEDQKGAQVFYYSNSAIGKEYAELMQDQLKKSLQDGNRRFAKANDNYYLLKKVSCPIVIVECGYLSNYEEATMLVEDKYQDKLAWSIHLGLLSFINQNIEKNPMPD